MMKSNKSNLPPAPSERGGAAHFPASLLPPISSTARFSISALMKNALLKVHFSISTLMKDTLLKVHFLMKNALLPLLRRGLGGGLILFSCQNTPTDNLEQALKLAGENRIELEKVLEHYGKNPADSLKLKAAKFLIENMEPYFFLASPELDDYYRKLDSIFSLNESWEKLTEEQEVLLSQLQQWGMPNCQAIPDLQYVSAEFLIDNIDQAFEAWKSPFAGDLSFEDFCEYILPYKANVSDRPDFWRSAYRDVFYPYVKFGLDTSCRLDSGLIIHYPFIEMDGNSFFSLPDHIFDTVPEFTVCCWANPYEYKQWARVFDLGMSDNCYICFIPYTQDGVSRFEIATPDTWDMITSAPLPSGQRSYIAITYSKNNISFYIDGILQKRIKTHLTNKRLISNYIGKSHFENDRSYFHGEIGDFRVYDRELNYTEISALAGKTYSPELRERLLDVVRAIRHLYDIDIRLESFIKGGCHPVKFMNVKKGNCDDYIALCNYIFRSLGIPSGTDFIPQWATRSLGHGWNALYTGNGRMEDYAFGDWWDTVGYHLQKNVERASKIFRKTYAKQPEMLAMQHRKGEHLPFFFQNPCVKDVTDNYLDCKDITVSLMQPPTKRRYAYLSNFNNRDWIPVHWGKIQARGHAPLSKESKVVFTKMGKDVAYLPVYYDRNGIQPAAEPFILTKDGEIEKLIPDHSKTQTLILTRKFRLGNVPKKGELLLGGRFQVANKEDFSDSLTVYVVNDIPEIRYNPVELDLNKPYRYFRFVSLPNLMGGEISEIEVYQKENGLKLSGRVLGNRNSALRGWEPENVFDGDPLTSYQCMWGDIGWVGLDFGKPVNIATFRYLPRNDDNFIKEGELYELFYWDNHQWNSLGQQIGTSKQYLEYVNAPTNALFWLRNLTKGKEERIFTYEDGRQVWW